ncbi:MAG: GreA/GreB family elongation factor [Candidatus Eiseniibacteriota bacterium]
MAIEPELLQHIKKKRVGEVESAWNARIDSAPRELGWFLEVAKELRGAKALSQMTELLTGLVDALGASDAWEAAFDVIRESLVLAPRNKELRDKALECVRTRYAARASLAEEIAFFALETADDPVRAFDELRDWLRFDEGEGFWLFGRGLGKVVETNLALQKIKLRFEKSAPLVVRRDEARKLLTWIPQDHFMMRRLSDPEGVRRAARAEPGEMLRMLLERFGRPLAAAEIKECMTGVIEGASWSAWWSKARAHPQVLPSKEKKGAFTWTGTSQEAATRIVEEFGSASLEKRVELARRFGKRDGEVSRTVVEGLRGDLSQVAASSPALALELVFLLEELGGGHDPDLLSVDEVLRRADAAKIIVLVPDRRYRERVYARVREIRASDWAAVFQEAFLLETDLRLLSGIYEALRADGPEGAAERLIAQTVSTPRKMPAAFVWVAKNVLVREELAARANHALLSKIAEALDSAEFRDMKAHLREHFEEGGIAFAVFERCDLDGAENLLTLIDSAALEEHRKTAIRRAIFRKYPRIRKSVEDDGEVLWATSEAAETKRQEFEKLVRTELPEATEAIRIAREYGDLSENFEYHAARQKHEFLSSRAARLQSELRRSRLIDPGTVDPTVVSIGTRVELSPLGAGEPFHATILGPWESSPEDGIYSNQSEFARRILGKRPEDRVELDSGEYRIARIEIWRPVGEAGQPETAVSRD